MSRKKIAIFGTYPPPIGGTSIYIKRLFELIMEEYDVVVFDTYGDSDTEDSRITKIENYKKFLVMYLFKCNHDIIHVHSHSWKDRFALSIISKLKRKRIIITYHSFRERYKEFSSLEKIMINMTLKLADYHHAVNSDMKKTLLEWGAKKDNVIVMPAFLLPRVREERTNSKDIIEFRDRFKFILSANASNTDLFEGVDLYGIDLCIELTHRLIKNFDVGFIFILTKITDVNYYQKIQKRIRDLNLEDNFMIKVNNESLLPILEISDVFIRPTNTDSFGISIGEALFLNKPAIASNVCKRIDGTILFENRNLKDLYDKVISVLENYSFYKNKVTQLNISDNSIDILSLYTKILYEE